MLIYARRSSDIRPRQIGSVDRVHQAFVLSFVYLFICRVHSLFTAPILISVCLSGVR